MSKRDLFKEFSEEKYKEYDKSYIKNDIDIESLIENIDGDEENVIDEKTMDYIKLINKLAFPDPKKAKKEQKHSEKLSAVFNIDESINEIKEAEPDDVHIDVKDFEDDLRVFESKKEKATDKTIEFDEEALDKMLKENAPLSFSEDELVDDEDEFITDNIFKDGAKKVKEIREASRMPNPLDLMEKDEASRSLAKKIASCGAMLIFSALAAIGLIYLDLSQNIPNMPLIGAISYSGNYKLFVLINLVLLGVTFVGGAQTLKDAITSLLNFRITPAVLISDLLIAAIIHNICAFFSAGNRAAYVFGALPAAAIFIYQYYNIEFLKKIKSDFKLLQFKPEKTCGSIVYNDSFSRAASESEDGVLSFIKKLQTIDTTNYFTRVLSDESDKFSIVTATIVKILSIIIFVQQWYVNKSFIAGLEAFIITLSFTALIILGVLDKLPFTSVSKKIKLSGAAIIGYDGVKTMSNIDHIVVEDRDLFPSKTLSLCGIKMYNGADVEDVVIDVTSVYKKVTGPMTSVMLDVIDNREELLRDATDIMYYDEKGVSAMVGGKLILIGNLELMSINLVRIPKDGIAQKIYSTGKVPLYIAVDGRLAAIFSLKYTENKNVKKYLKRINSNGIGIIVKTADPNLTQDFICQKYNVNPRNVKIMPSRLIESYESLEFEEGLPPIVTITKDIAAYLRAQSAINKIKNLMSINKLICFAAILVGITATAFLALVNDFSIVTPLHTIVMGIWWFIPISLITMLSKLKV